ncbi:MAG: thioredoxin [Acidimicrobiales bacterium]
MSNTVACTTCGTRNRTPVVTGGRPRCASCKADLPWLVDATGDELTPALDQSALPVLVDLWAPWCGPCKAVAPALEQLAADLAGSLRVVKVNVDNAPEVSARLGVQGIPTMVLYRGGVEIARQVGALPGHAIRQWVDQALA